AGARRGTARPDRGCALRRIPHVGRQARRLTVLLRPAAPARTSPRYSRSWLSELVVDPREQRVDVEGLRDDRVRAEPVGLRGGGAMRGKDEYRCVGETRTQACDPGEGRVALIALQGKEVGDDEVGVRIRWDRVRPGRQDGVVAGIGED